MIEKYLAIIPARGGSKRIPKKNIKLFLGQPIIKYSIDAAIKSGVFNMIMVSTDDEEIAKISRSYGAEIPFMRSEKTSDDHAMLADVLEEVLKEYKKRSIEFTAFCCILPTAPFIKPNRLVETLRILKEKHADSVIPVVKFSYPIQRALRAKNGLVEMFWPENYNKRSQDLEQAYHDVGQFYWMKTNSFFKQRRLFAERTSYLEIPEYEAQDIDSQDDWSLAEMKYEILTKKLKR